MVSINELKKKVSPSNDYVFKKIKIDGKTIFLIFNDVLTDGGSIDENILRKLVLLNRKELKHIENYLPIRNIKIIKNEEILYYVNNGYLVVVTNKIYACEVKAKLDRGINMVDGELTIAGPKDSFTENFNSNLGLIRKRIKSSNLKVIDLEIGRSSKTKVGILYVEDIVKEEIPSRIMEVLSKIDIDGIIDSSYLKTALEGQKSYFPTIMMSERPDKSSMALLEGKVVIIVDMSPYALILPSFFIDFFHTTDDYYQKSFNTTFIRIIRLLAFFIAIFTPALYISVTTRNYNLIPLDLLLVLKAGRTFVPFPAYIEALFMIVCFEILKESDLRMSYTSGSSISILGGLILGDAAVSAGIVSPIMIIVIAISSIAGLIFSSVELENAIRIYKIFLLILGTIWGIYGVSIGAIYIAYKLLTLKMFGIPYLVPFIPLEKNELKDTFIKGEQSVKKRNSFLTKNIIRGKYKWRKL
mgnify:FL=1